MPARIALLTCVSAMNLRPVLAQFANGDSGDVARLPLREVPVASTGRRLAFLITGDGGYAPGDRGIANTFAEHGIPTIVLNSREYLGHKRVPDEVARDAASIIRRYLDVWHRDSVIFVGYSRGADMAPFIVTRLPAELRNRLSLVAMVGLGERAGFQFHWTDIVKDTPRPTDLMVAPEVLKISGVRMLCLYGESEKHSLCPTLPATVLRSDRHGGKHELSGSDGVAVAGRILREIE